MISRDLSSELIRLANSFKVVSITGPRQSGKTTLVRHVFAKMPYVSLENPDIFSYAIEDPRSFLGQYREGAVFDEIQRTPMLFSYLQEIIDNSDKKGHFILTGSNNFLLQQSINQTLAGRIASLELLPFSLGELRKHNLASESDNQLLLKGFYPPVYDQNILPSDWYPNYIRTYIERDVRQIRNVSNLIIFERFLSLIAGRCSCELNMSALSNEVGVDVKTIQSWIGILESSYIIFLLKAYHKNFNKTIVKRPKIYFYDTALVCYLLRIHSEEQLMHHPLRGNLFENMVVSEMVKQYCNLGIRSPLYYWRNKTGNEIDIVVDNGYSLIPVEIKSAKTVSSDFFKNLLYWKNLSETKKSFLIYAGDQHQKRSNDIEVINWRNTDVKKFEI